MATWTIWAMAGVLYGGWESALNAGERRRIVMQRDPVPFRRTSTGAVAGYEEPPHARRTDRPSIAQSGVGFISERWAVLLPIGRFLGVDGGDASDTVLSARVAHAE